MPLLIYLNLLHFLRASAKLFCTIGEASYLCLPSLEKKDLQKTAQLRGCCMQGPAAEQSLLFAAVVAVAAAIVVVPSTDPPLSLISIKRRQGEPQKGQALTKTGCPPAEREVDCTMSLQGLHTRQPPSYPLWSHCSWLSCTNPHLILQGL